MTARTERSEELSAEQAHAGADSFDALLEAAVRPSDSAEERALRPSRFLRLATGTRIAQRFTVEWCAGAGGMGDVYRCRDAESGEHVAVKVIRKLGDQGRFRREASILSALRHEAIVRYIAHGVTDPGMPYLAMEWLEGEDLGKQLRRSRLSVCDCLTLARRMCSGLALAHAQGFVHRDIKPSNVFLERGRVEDAKLLDFGIAHGGASTQTATRAGTVLGTVGYMAPDQASGSGLPDARDDLFSLGCVLYECLTGRPAFAGETSVAVLEAVLHCEPPHLMGLRSDVPRELAELVASLLHKRRQDRPRHASEILGLLDRLHAAHAPVAQPDLPRRASAHTHAVLVIASADETGDSGPPRMLRDIAARFDASALNASGPHLMLAMDTRGERSVIDRMVDAVACARALQEVQPDWRLTIECVNADAPRLPPLSTSCAAKAEQTARAPIALGPLARTLYGTRAQLDDDALGASLATPRAAVPFVGRQKELQVLDAVHRQCIDESITRSLLVSAPAGLGKTRLLCEFLSQVAARAPSRVVVVQASRSERGAPMSLARLLASQLAARAAPGTSGADILAFAERVRSACAGSPLIVCIDDAQWVDLESMKWLETLLATVADTPLLIVALMRQQEAPGLRSLWKASGAHELSLRPLHDDAAERLLEPFAVAANERPALVQTARGNPRLLLAMAMAAADPSDVFAEAAAALLLERLSLLPEAERCALGGASLLGARFLRSELLAALDNATDLERALSALCAEHWLTTAARADDEPEYRFAHELARHAARFLALERERNEQPRSPDGELRDVLDSETYASAR